MREEGRRMGGKGEEEAGWIGWTFRGIRATGLSCLWGQEAAQVHAIDSSQNRPKKAEEVLLEGWDERASEVMIMMMLMMMQNTDRKM